MADGRKLYVVEADGSRLRGIADVMTEIEHHGHPELVGPMTYFSVSPDGSRVVYSTCRFAADPPRDDKGQIQPWADYPITWYRYEIVTSNLDGSDVRRLTDNRSDDNYPVWSPDGSRIAFIRHPEEYWDPGAVYTMSADGSEILHLTPEPAEFHKVVSAPPSWSPDGEKLAFAAGSGIRWIRDIDFHPAAVYTVNADGTGMRRVLGTLSPPAWSPDGRRIAHIRIKRHGMALYTMSPEGTDHRTVFVISERYAYWVESVSWSPDGNHIQFACGAAVCVVNMDGSLLRGPSVPMDTWLGNWLERRSGSGAVFPASASGAWFPDGSRLAVLTTTGSYYLGRDETLNLETTTPDGQDQQVLVSDDGWGPVPEHSGYQDTAAGVAACSAGFIVPEPENSPGLVRDCRVLLGLRDTLAGGTRLNWGPGVPMDLWKGVVVGPAQPELAEPAYVESLVLYSSSLRGSIPPELGGLKDLRSLRLSGNWLTGRIPPELGNLKELQDLHLSDNLLTGSILPELGNLKHLQSLYLSGNQLTGSIPPELGNLEELES